ncbi:HET-domain-containing protein [Thozetella sp. PMI_491]|nr:HET-domain-containing protein [Thozetella sp. PMI_491]
MLGIELSPYDTLKTDSYSNKFDLRSKDHKCSHTAYRLIVYVEGQPQLYGLLQYVAVGERGPDRYFFGREIDKRKIDIGLLRRWLRRCQDCHEGNCSQDGVAGRRLPDNLRLIDVRRRRIVRLSSDKHGPKPEYLTLSYVWGEQAMKEEDGMEPAVLKRAMIQTNGADEEDTPLPKQLPRTVRDAIHLTEKLGFDYVWIDALCIVQDDPDEEKQKSLERMDAIYNCSTITIAAASGHHANAGIPGIGVARTRFRLSERVGGMQIATMSPSFAELENSHLLTWNTRGWTFQEKILAKRILLFTDFQVYFKCSESIWIEEAFMETDDLSKSIEARPEKYRWGPDRPSSDKFLPSGKTMLLKIFLPQLNVDDPWGYLGRFPDYAAAVREYTQRTVSNPNDILKAIHGVFLTLKSDTGDFIYGHPENYFLQSLLWHPEPGARLNQVYADLPSWSWASWQTDKGIRWDVLDVRVLRSIMITMRNLFKRLLKTLAKILEKTSSESGGQGSSSSSAGQGSGSGSYSSSSSSTSSSSPASSSSPQPSPLIEWYTGRSWSTKEIMGKATGNVAFCFALPLAIRTHTVRELHLCHDGHVSEMSCDETLALATFLEDDASAREDDAHERKQKMTPARRRQLIKISRHSKTPFLSMWTVVIQLKIGHCLQQHPPVHEDEVGIFELVDTKGRCVGELWTTLGVVEREPNDGYNFLTISWGLSLSHAEIDEDHIPRWPLDAATLPESKTFMKLRPLLEGFFTSPPRKSLAGRYGQGPNGAAQKSMDDYNVVSFLDAVLTAKCLEPQPKFLWSTVNLMLVEMDEDMVARRAGIGKIIFGAWLKASMLRRPEEVLLV